MSKSPIVTDALDNGLRILTEEVSQVRSVTIGVWLTRGSRHETLERSGIAHFVEHMLFKGTQSRSAQDIAEVIDSIGGQLDAFTAREYASYYIKVLDEHLPLALDILSDIVRNPAFAPDDIDREKKVVLEEIKMVEDTPDDLVHELFTQGFWEDHPLGRPILGVKETVESFTFDLLSSYFRQAYVPENMIVAAVGNLQHARLRELVHDRFGDLRSGREPARETPPVVVPKVIIRNKDLEQSHICIGATSYPQDHAERYTISVLNTLLGGSMSSRLFQNIRERRGLAYAVFSGYNAYRDAGAFTVYAGCANEAVGEVVDLIVEELRAVKRDEVSAAELRRAKDHLKGSRVLSLESTSNRMFHLAGQAIYFDRLYGMDEALAGIESVTAQDVQRVAAELFQRDALSATILGDVNGLQIQRERLDVG